jgi:hypothetical protein
MLSKNFKDDKINNFDQIFKEKIDMEIDKIKTESVEHDKINTDFILVKNLNFFLKKMKSSLISGEDQISNLLLKKRTKKFGKVLLHLFRLSISTHQIATRWKNAIV